MASPVQTPAYYRSKGSRLNYTPVAAVIGGDVIVVANRVYVATEDIAANILGSVAAEGIFAFPKDASVFVAGDPVYWNATGSPLSPGVASSGCATSSSAGAVFAGYVPPADSALTGDLYIGVRLMSVSGIDGPVSTPSATVAATGSTQTDAAVVGTGFTLVTAADATKGVKLPTAVAGLVCEIKNADAANAILKIWPNTSDAVNALSANAAFSIAAKTSVRLIAYDATTWYSIPLLPS